MNDRPDDGRLARIGQLAELGLLSASLAHEVRQPLFAMKAMVELELHQTDPSRHGRLRAMLTAVEQIDEIVGWYSSAGRVEEEQGLVDVHDPVHAAVSMLGHRSRIVRATLRYDAAPEALWVQGRAGLLRQVFVNLLQNALDAVEGRERRQVEIRLRRDGDAAVVEVVDSGSGFSAAVQADIFQPFVTSKPPGRGTGLGLYIARRAVEEAGGQLELVSTSPAGTNMRARLPLVLANR